jgi:hypothetical protein
MAKTNVGKIKNSTCMSISWAKWRQKDGGDNSQVAMALFDGHKRGAFSGRNKGPTSY